MKFVCGLTFLIITSLYAFTQNDSTNFILNLEIRERFESWNGMNASNYGDANGIGKLNDNILLQRIIGGFTYKPIKNIEFTANLQDSRAFGWSLSHNKDEDIFKNPSTEITMNPNEQFFEIHDIFIKYSDIITGLSLTAGRQKIFYGDNRIFGPGNWGNTGRWTWDALRFSYKKNNSFIDIFAGGTKTHNPVKTSIPFSETQFWGGGMYARYEFNDNIIAEPFYALKTKGSADNISENRFVRNWGGTRIFNRNASWLYDISYINQFGYNNDLTNKAFAVIAKIGYQFNNITAKPLLSFRESYATGGIDGSIDRNFESAFGSRDRYYGWLNILSLSNLDNREIILELSPNEDIWIEIKFNRYYIPAPANVVILNSMKLKNGENHLGDEYNLLARYRFNNHICLTAVFGYFVTGTLEEINNQTPQNAFFWAIQFEFEL